jgi:hypothetical protein
MQFRCLTACLLACAVMTACQSPESSPTALPTAVPTMSSQAISSEIAVQLAYQQVDALARRDAVISAINQFAADAADQRLSDEEASLRLTEAAFASQQLKLTDPAFVRREGALAVIGLPDALGLYFFDGAGASTQISQWTAGLSAVNVIWREDEIGVVYETIGADGTKMVHFALLTNDAKAWRVSWISDDMPDWWFNARNATLDIQPDLSSIAVVGEAQKSTVTFEEGEGTPQRLFRLVWERDLDLYQLNAPISGYDSREAWLWNVAVPSAYATLVEFIERLQRQQVQQATALTVNSTVMDEALDFGFHLIGASYKVMLSEPDRLIVQGHQGTFEIGFQELEGLWRITSIKPTGIPQP